MITEHAQKRMQQRSMGPDLLELMDMMGQEGEQKGGALLQEFPKKEIDQLIKRYKRLGRELHRAKNAFCIRGDNDKVVTAGHKTRKIRTMR